MGERGTGSLITNVERKSGYTMIEYVTHATATAIREKTKERFEKIPKKKRKTMTYDNGSEFAGYEMIERETGLLIYFAHPYHSWERGTNENTNGLIRQFFPKKTSFVKITKEATRRVERLLNTRPRKRFGLLDSKRNPWQNSLLTLFTCSRIHVWILDSIRWTDTA